MLDALGLFGIGVAMIISAVFRKRLRPEQGWTSRGQLALWGVGVIGVSAILLLIELMW